MKINPSKRKTIVPIPKKDRVASQLALYVYEYLLHVGAQKSAQTFLSEIRWEKNITLGEPPGFLHSWWCVFWDLYCAAPDRRETCEHSSEAKAFHDYSAAAAPSPVMGNMPPNDAMPGGPMPPGFFQPFMSPRYPGGPRPSLRMPNQPGGIPGSQPLLPNSLDPTRPQGKAEEPPLAFLVYPKVFTVTYSSSSPGNYVGPPGGGGPPGTPIMPSPGERKNDLKSFIIPSHQFPMGPGPDGPMGAMGAMEPHHMNGSLGSGDMDGLPKSSPNNMGGMNNPPGTPRDDGEMGGNFLNPFQSESYSPNMTMSV
uniref:Single stranded DNA binding protein 4 n=1 Tax=Poecilia reticulata TaxID=8081 RepID=A0A3P9NZ60_POERE